jgi:hypothetical protein
MLGATMPETAVHKNSNAFLPENKIWLAKDFLMSSPAGDFVPSENKHESQLRFLVPMRFDA